MAEKTCEAQNALMHIAVFEVLYPTHPNAFIRMGRRYTVGFEDTMLTVVRSGPVRPSSVHVERFGSEDELLENVREKLKRRFRHGYVLVWWTEEFPLLAWIGEHGWPVEPRTVLVPGIQLELPLG
jgi:hypothetical protein